MYQHSVSIIRMPHTHSSSFFFYAIHSLPLRALYSHHIVIIQTPLFVTQRLAVLSHH